MLTRTRCAAAVAAGALLLGGCGSPGLAETDPAAVAGRWGSTFSSEFVDLQLRQAASAVEGSAVLTPAGHRAEYTVSGTVRGAELQAVLRGQGGGDAVALRGTLRGDTLAVRLDGGGFADRLVLLVRV